MESGASAAISLRSETSLCEEHAWVTRGRNQNATWGGDDLLNVGFSFTQGALSLVSSCVLHLCSAHLLVTKCWRVFQGHWVKVSQMITGHPQVSFWLWGDRWGRGASSKGSSELGSPEFYRRAWGWGENAQQCQRKTKSEDRAISRWRVE